MTEQEVLDALRENLTIPSGFDITSQAMGEILGEHASDKTWIKENFSNLVERVQREAYTIYLNAERPAVSSSLRRVLGSMLPREASAGELFDVIERNFWALDRFFLSLTQGRRPRAGNAFEHVIKILFRALEYPYSPRPLINGRPDFLLPSSEHFEMNPMDCIIFTVKRTLRERWRQITTEGTQGHQFFLATIDEGVGVNDLREMLRNRIYLVVPEAIRGTFYPAVTNVISFENFFLNHLDPAMNRWRANGVIP